MHGVMAANAEQAHAKSLIANYVVIILLLTILWLLYEGVSYTFSFYFLFFFSTIYNFKINNVFFPLVILLFKAF